MTTLPARLLACADEIDADAREELFGYRDILREAAAALSVPEGEAVAPDCLRGETYAHGLMTELQVQHAEGVEFPIGTKFYTTPQPGETP